MRRTFQLLSLFYSGSQSLNVHLNTRFNSPIDMSAIWIALKVMIKIFLIDHDAMTGVNIWRELISTFIPSLPANNDTRHSRIQFTKYDNIWCVLLVKILFWCVCLHRMAFNKQIANNKMYCVSIVWCSSNFSIWQTVGELVQAKKNVERHVKRWARVELLFLYSHCSYVDIF